MSKLLRRESEGPVKDFLRSLKVGVVIMAVLVLGVSAVFVEPHAKEMVHQITGRGR